MKRSTSTLIPIVIAASVNTSCLADWQASSLLPAPIHCDVTTAPPVASAASTLMIKLLNMSTSDTPETAASPAEEIIIVSAIPTVMASVCSKISGIISFRKSFLLNNRFSVTVCLTFFHSFGMTIIRKTATVKLVK